MVLHAHMKADRECNK